MPTSWSIKNNEIRPLVYHPQLEGERKLLVERIASRHWQDSPLSLLGIVNLILDTIEEERNFNASKK